VLFSKEQDPSQLRTATPSKLVRYLVEDGTIASYPLVLYCFANIDTTGAHVNASTPFAEVEVMKMYMPLVTHNSGIIHFTKVRATRILS